MKRFKRLKKLGAVCLVAILSSMNTMSVFADEVITTPVICDDEELIENTNVTLVSDTIESLEGLNSGLSKENVIGNEAISNEAEETDNDLLDTDNETVNSDDITPVDNIENDNTDDVIFDAEVTEELTDEEIVEETEAGDELIEREETFNFGNKSVAVSGNIPQNAEIVVQPITYKSDMLEDVVTGGDENVEFTIYEAFDIKIMLDNEVWQPCEHESIVKITIYSNSIDGDNTLNVHRIDGNEVTNLSSDTNNNEITFETEHFTTFVVDGTTYDSNDGYFEAYGKVYNINNAIKRNFVAERNWQADIIFGYLFDDLYAIPTFDYTNEDGYFVPAASGSGHNVLDPSFGDDISKSDLEGKKLFIGDNVFTSISDFTFADTGIVGELVLPNSIRRIEKRAFKNTNLTNVTIPSGVTYIDDAVFYMCEDLETITLNNVKITNDIGDSVHFPTLYTNNGTGEPIDKLESYVLYNDILAKPRITTYTITYLDTNATGGSAPSSDTVNASSNYEIKSGALARDGYLFKGWNDGTNTYNPGDIITVTGNITLSPVWDRVIPTYTITYTNTGATDGTAPAAEIVNENESYVIKSGSLSRTGYIFKGWSDGITIYQAGDSVMITNNLTLSPVWELDISSGGSGGSTPTTYTITYLGTNSTSGSVPSLSDPVVENTAYPVKGKGTLARDGYIFKGWSNGITTYQPGDIITVTSSMTLSPVWEIQIFTVTYLSTNATGGSTPSTDTVNANTVYVVKSGTLTRTNYTFKGWKIQGSSDTVYVAGDTITITSNIILSPVWEEISGTGGGNNSNTGSGDNGNNGGSNNNGDSGDNTDNGNGDNGDNIEPSPEKPLVVPPVITPDIKPVTPTAPDNNNRVTEADDYVSSDNNGSGDSIDEAVILSNEANDGALKAPVNTDDNIPKSKRPIVLRSIIGTVIAGGVIIGLTATGTFKSLYLTLLLLLFRKKRATFKGVLTTEERNSVKVELNKEEETLSDIISTYHTISEIVERVRMLHSKTTLPPFTRMLISYVDASDTIEMTLNANEEKMYDLLADIHGNVNVTIYNTTYDVECELNFTLD